ncbi:UNVERIFIED_ORG: hypothetical protein M2414_003881 [Rahnella aquatilis]
MIRHSDRDPGWDAVDKNRKKRFARDFTPLTGW